MREDHARLATVFIKYPEIQAVYQFGSSVTGKQHRESDLVLAIVPSDSRIHSQKIDILADLTRLGFDNVDLIFLDIDDLVLRYEAVKHNQLIYQTEDFDPGSFYSMVIRQYLDFLPFLKVQREAYKERILQELS